MKQAIVAAAFVAGITAMSAGTAHAGVDTDTLGVTIAFRGDSEKALAAANALTFELFEDGVDVSALCSSGVVTSDEFRARVSIQCSSLSDGSFTLGASDVDDFEAAEASCTTSGGVADKEIELAGAAFTHTAGQTHTCFVRFDPLPEFSIDVVVDGGPATASDFEIELYESLDADPVATAVDPADTTCAIGAADTADCAVVALAEGTYFFGAVEVPGYAPTSVSCEDDFVALKPFDGSIGQFDFDGSGNTACTVTMSFNTQTVSADIDVINDNDGTASGADFTIEFFDANGELAASGVDPEPGTGNASLEVELPIGTYRVGVEGPEGYDVSVAITQVPVIADDIDLVSKPIDGDAAAFEITDALTAQAVVTADDQAADPPAPTTVPDTMPPVTTAPPAPPTTIEPTDVLPATGSTTSGLVALAFGLVLLGGGAVLATRRS